MQQLEQLFQQILDNDVFKLIISKPKQKDNEYKKIVIEKKVIIIKFPNIQRSKYFTKM